MFKFLFGRQRLLRYDVYYTYGINDFVLKEQVFAESEYDANRKFDQRYGGERHRLANQTRLAR